MVSFTIPWLGGGRGGGAIGSVRKNVLVAGWSCLFFIQLQRDRETCALMSLHFVDLHPYCPCRLRKLALSFGSCSSVGSQDEAR